MCFHVLEYVIYANISEYILENTKKIFFMYLCIMSHIQHWFEEIKNSLESSCNMDQFGLH